MIVRQKVTENKGGLILHDEDLKKKFPRGTVVASSIPEIKVEDEILFSDYAGERIIENGEELLVVRESEIMAKIC